jgi:hypothetical protein
VEAGLGDALGTGLGVVCGDFDGDGWIDIFVANDGMDDRLWMNQGDGRFVDRALLAGCAIDEGGTPKAGMGVTAADVDDDGDLDLLVCNLHDQTDSFYRNEGGYFADRTAAVGLAPVSRRFTRFGLAWMDLDNDGWLDIFQANGRVIRQDTLFAEDVYAEPNLLLRGLGEGRLEEVRPRGGTAEPLVFTSRAAAFGDVDNDGGVDILVVNINAPAHLLMNAAPQRGHWLQLRVLDEHGRDAIGASVSVQAGDRTITRDVRTAYSYCAANDPRVHVGLGDIDRIESITVRWVDRAVEEFGGAAADQILELRKGAGESDSGESD